MVLHKIFHRKVVLHSDHTVVKSGKCIAVGEAKAPRVAAQAGVPVPCVHDAQTTFDGESRISMDYIQGKPLDELWLDMSPEQKDIARQLREMIEKIRSITPPPHFIGACDGTEIRDTRLYFTYHSPRVATKKPSTSSCYQASTNRPLRSCGQRFLGDCELTIALSSPTAISCLGTSWFRTERSRDLLVGR